MSPKDEQAVSNWLNGRCSLRHVESLPSMGLVENERFTEQARRAFRLIWGWGSLRFEGRFGSWQDRVYKRWGADFVDRRIARCNRIARERFNWRTQ